MLVRWLPIDGFVLVVITGVHSGRWVVLKRVVETRSWPEKSETKRETPTDSEQSGVAVAVALPLHSARVLFWFFDIVNSHYFLAFGAKIHPSYMESGTRNRLVTFKRPQKAQKYPKSGIVILLQRETTAVQQIDGSAHASRVRQCTCSVLRFGLKNTKPRIGPGDMDSPSSPYCPQM